MGREKLGKGEHEKGRNICGFAVSYRGENIKTKTDFTDRA